MKKTDFDQFTLLWAATCELYGRQPSDAALGMAFRALRSYDLQDVRQALDAHINDPGDGRFAPKPADIVKHIKGDPESRALSAWSRVEKAIRGIGPWETIVFDDPIIMATVEAMGGWIQLCDVSDKELPFRRNEFATRYRGSLTKPPESYPRKLIGKSEHVNSIDYPDRVPEPILIGDTQKALAVYQGGQDGSQGPVKLGQAMQQLKITQESSDQ